MIRRLTVTLVCLLATQVISATETPAAVREGRLLAEELSKLRPAEDSCHSGTLKIYDGRRVRAEIPVQLQTIVTATNWQTVYRTTGTNHAHAASLTVIYTENQPNQYQLLNPALPDGQTNQFAVLTGNDAMIPFAGSDFWLADLGLEFLRWPEQRILKKEVRRSQSCNVLESTNPNPAAGTYARVVSWIDIDTGGIVYAEAFDANRRRMKEFLPKAVKKVDGQYQVQRMEMYGSQTRSRTVLEFDFDAP
jgi:hypothetical protein